MADEAAWIKQAQIDASRAARLVEEAQQAQRDYDSIRPPRQMPADAIRPIVRAPAVEESRDLLAAILEQLKKNNTLLESIRLSLTETSKKEIK